jgi:hypothetical protein
MATKKLKDMTTAELQVRLKVASGRAYKATNRTWLIEKITEVEAANAKTKAAAKATASTALARRRSARAAGTAQASTALAPVDAEDDAVDADADAAPMDGDEASDADTATAPVPEARAKRTRHRWAGMTTDELRALYVSTVGRESSSDDRGYLMWKIREAEKGRVRTGPVTSRAKGEPATPVTMRIADTTLAALDEVWRRRGYRSRLQLLSHAIRLGMVSLGERGAAGGFLPNGPATATSATGGAQ